MLLPSVFLSYPQVSPSSISSLIFTLSINITLPDALPACPLSFSTNCSLSSICMSFRAGHDKSLIVELHSSWVRLESTLVPSPLSWRRGTRSSSTSRPGSPSPGSPAASHRSGYSLLCPKMTALLGGISPSVLIQRLVSLGAKRTCTRSCTSFQLQQQGSKAPSGVDQ